MILNRFLEGSLDIKTSNSIEKNIQVAKEYFSFGNFKIDEELDYIELKQGSVLKNGLTINPLKWKSKFCITFNDDSVYLDYDIDAEGAMVSKRNLELWNSVLVNYKGSLMQGRNIFHQNYIILKESKRAFYRNLVKICIFSIFFLSLFGVLADYYELSTKYAFLISILLSTLMQLILAYLLKKG